MNRLPFPHTRPRWMGGVRWLVYTAGFRPNPGTVLFSPSLDVVVGFRAATGMPGILHPCHPVRMRRSLADLARDLDETDPGWRREYEGRFIEAGPTEWLPNPNPHVPGIDLEAYTAELLAHPDEHGGCPDRGCGPGCPASLEPRDKDEA